MMIGRAGIQKLFVVICGIFVVALLLEMGVRAGGAVVSLVQEYQNRVRIEKGQSIRILCLGDSTTDRQYPEYLQETLNKNREGMRFTVIDKGVSAMTSSSVLALLEKNIEKYRPHMIITMIGIHDNTNLVPWLSADARRTSFWEHFRIYRLFVMQKRQLKIRRVTARRIQQSTQGNDRPTSFVSPIKYRSVLPGALKLIRAGRNARKGGRFAEAEEMYKKALSYDGKCVLTYQALGELYQEQGRYEEAERILKKGLEIYPDDTSLNKDLGSQYFITGRHAEARPIFVRLVGNSQADWMAYFVLGGYYLKSNNLKNAEKMFAQALQSDPSIFSYMNLAKAYRLQGKNRQAEELLRQGLEQSSLPADCFYGALAIDCLERKDYAGADAYFQKAEGLRLEYIDTVLATNYVAIAKIASQHNIRFVCMQYPVRSIRPLKEMFAEYENIIFVDNEGIFKRALREGRYDEYFVDQFAGDFGHCNERGNRLIAENLARIILRKVSH